MSASLVVHPLKHKQNLTCTLKDVDESEAALGKGKAGAFGSGDMKEVWLITPCGPATPPSL